MQPPLAIKAPSCRPLTVMLVLGRATAAFCGHYQDDKQRRLQQLLHFVVDAVVAGGVVSAVVAAAAAVAVLLFAAAAVSPGTLCFPIILWVF